MFLPEGRTVCCRRMGIADLRAVEKRWKRGRKQILKHCSKQRLLGGLFSFSFSVSYHILCGFSLGGWDLSCSQARCC